MNDPLRLPCPTCSGTRSTTTGDRHADTNMDVCATCHDEGWIPARTGESPEASFQHSPTVRRIIGPTILLASGNYFDLLAPEHSTFTIEDVAHGLSNTCRFAGQCIRFYSVAQHSVIVSQHVPPEFAFAGLMHDAAEAFIGDITKPLKDILPDYRALEKRIEAAVLQRFGLPAVMPPEVKEIDVVMLATEQAQLMRNRDDWNYTRGRTPIPIEIPAMGPEAAKAAFLARYAEVRAQGTGISLAGKAA